MTLCCHTGFAGRPRLPLFAAAFPQQRLQRVPQRHEAAALDVRGRTHLPLRDAADLGLGRERRLAHQHCTPSFGPCISPLLRSTTLSFIGRPIGVG